jgi:antagonist of KipI
MILHVLEAGLYTLVVDFGRPDARSLGVPVGGAADRTALSLGNALVGNSPDAAALEINGHGPMLRADEDVACVLFGAPFQLASSQQDLKAGKTFTLHAGEPLHIGGTPEGMRAYLCLRGGLQVPTILGSRSGLQALAAGAELQCLAGTIAPRYLRAAWASEDVPEDEQRLRALAGPQASWFPTDRFFSTGADGPRFTVGRASNRMGLRLQGPALPVPNRELLSEPVCPGSVQVTRDGQCIILGVDGQTIGGYPKIAQVISADLDRLGQLRPSEEIRFVQVELAEAERLWRRKQAILHQWLMRLRASLVD